MALVKIVTLCELKLSVLGLKVYFLSWDTIVKEILSLIKIVRPEKASVLVLCLHHPFFFVLVNGDHQATVSFSFLLDW